MAIGYDTRSNSGALDVPQLHNDASDSKGVDSDQSQDINMPTSEPNVAPSPDSGPLDVLQLHNDAPDSKGVDSDQSQDINMPTSEPNVAPSPDSGSLDVPQLHNDAPDSKGVDSDQSQDINMPTSEPTVAPSPENDATILPNLPVTNVKDPKIVILADVLVNGSSKYKHSRGLESSVPSPIKCNSNIESSISSEDTLTESQKKSTVTTDYSGSILLLNDSSSESQETSTETTDYSGSILSDVLLIDSSSEDTLTESQERSTMTTDYSGSILADVLLNGSSKYRCRYKNAQIINVSSKDELLNGSPYYKKSSNLENNFVPPVRQSRNEELSIASHEPTPTVEISDLDDLFLHFEKDEISIKDMTNIVAGLYTTSMRNLEVVYESIHLLKDEETATDNGIAELRTMVNELGQKVVALERKIKRKHYDIKQYRSEMVDAEEKLQKIRQLQNM